MGKMFEYMDFRDEINDSTSNHLINTVNKHIDSNPELCKLQINFSSLGGSLFSGFNLYHHLSCVREKIRMVNVGCVESIAVIVFLAADERLAVKRSSFLIHNFYWMFEAGKMGHNDIAEIVQRLDNHVNNYCDIFGERTSGAQKPLCVRKHLRGESLRLCPQQAKEHGMIANLIDFEISTRAGDLSKILGIEDR